MGVGLKYVAPLVAAGAAAISIAAMPTALADDWGTHGGGHGGPYCGQYCGSYTAYNSAGFSGSHGRTGEPVALNAYSGFRRALPNR